MEIVLNRSLLFRCVADFLPWSDVFVIVPLISKFHQGFILDEGNRFWLVKMFERSKGNNKLFSQNKDLLEAIKSVIKSYPYSIFAIGKIWLLLFSKKDEEKDSILSTLRSVKGILDRFEKIFDVNSTVHLFYFRYLQDIAGVHFIHVL
ncbi:hypothetical protein RFI_11320 [Reticulomyxa filosa]|uniref:Uncharacterized protein n=1 Tax=Reticulomyxa filosa TaxID=46433 RepID=X6NIT7_RETFI|nr:hypothetical protein RFI_11320 [Reticulomyxa filosa]|eukprot:ETO25818.1 hypothetical protein RFI_11320 [Reticulomyxa filosa]